MTENKCGQCVVRNAFEDDEVGDCSRTNGPRLKDEPACDQFFGLEQLRAPNYGKKA